MNRYILKYKKNNHKMKNKKYHFKREFYLGAIGPIDLRLALVIDRYLNGKQCPVIGGILKSFSLFW
jgi:hypothetical protein